MNTFNIILSSVVIVAIINIFIQNKINHIQNITQNRTNWRSDLKKYMEKIPLSDKPELKSILIALRVNLNGYGCHRQGKYPADECLDFFKDEHILKEIDIIEEGLLAKKRHDKFIEEHIQRLISFISLLLKFDWERSKKEIKMDMILISSIGGYFILIGFYCFQATKFLNITNTINVGTSVFFITIMPYFVLWMPYLLNKIKIFKKVKWYKVIGIYPYAWAAGAMLFIFCIFLLNIMYKVRSSGGYLLCLCLFVLAIFYPIIIRNRYYEYDKAIMKVMNINNLVIYSMKSGFNFIPAASFFINKGLNYREEDDCILILNNESFLTYFEQLTSKDKLKSLRFHSRYLYKIKKECSIIDYILDNPKRCKYIVCYGGDNNQEELKYSVGRQKKKWAQWISSMKAMDME